MLRFVFAATLALFLFAAITRARALRRAVYVVFGLMLLYVMLKLTGVIDAMAPSRDGVF